MHSVTLEAPSLLHHITIVLNIPPLEILTIVIAAKEFRLQHSSSAGAALPRSSSTELKQPKALRVDTAKVISDLDPRSPAHTPEMASEPLRG